MKRVMGLGLQGSAEVTRPVPTPASRPAAMDLGEVREYIDRHCARPLTIDVLADLAGLSTFHSIRAIRAAHGQTPHQLSAISCRLSAPDTAG